MKNDAAKAVKDGYAFGLGLRKRGALREEFTINVTMWVDGEGRPYRQHLLRPEYLAGFTAGYHGKPCPVA